MAITKEARRKIFSLVQNSKDLLVKEVESQLEQYFGIHANGSVIDVDLLTSKDADKIYTARILRQRLKYIQANQLSGDKSIKDAIRLLISEEAFTILNRFASLRMAEERNIIRESVRNAYNSEGFQVFDSITGQGQVTDIYTRYSWYLNAIFDELAIDLPALFKRFSPFALVFPSEQALIRLLDIINNEEITIYREEGLQPVNLWKEDETIGWIYQYYNSREEITEMREASSAPRNSRELAVRNQFFTPRYVVQFLTDNSLGRIWYEMTQGQTKLVQLCTYLIHRNNEVFLQKGQTKPENADPEIQYIDYKKIKDPRKIKMLDPACGSMHFGLYSFDVFELIYIEAWDKYPNLLTDLRDKYTRADFIAQIPVLIIRHNIHGVDIDPRALQIAGLSLWLRAQKSFDKLGLQAKDRPTITRANLVLAEPMPGNEKLLNSLLKPLDLPMQQLVRAIWNKMLLAGETGLLLKIEQEITAEIAKITKEWVAYAKQVQAKLGDTPEQIEKAKQAVKYSESDYWQNFFNTAEQQVLDILKQLAEEATNGEAYQTLLFAEDAQRGFAFIELCQQQYDVIVMNPPFGACTDETRKYIETNFPKGKNDLAACFIERMHEMLSPNGKLGAITTRTIFFIGSFKSWREYFFIENQFLQYFADLGGNVLDAMVETAAYIFSNAIERKSYFLRIAKTNEKERLLKNCLNLNTKEVYSQNTSNFKNISNQPLCYWLDEKTLNLFNNTKKYEQVREGARVGLKTFDNERFVRNFWECKTSDLFFPEGKPKWISFILTDESLRFFYNGMSVANWKNDGKEIRGFVQQKNRSIEGENSFFSIGLSWAFRTDRFEPHIIQHNTVGSSGRFIALFKDKEEILTYCAFWNSVYSDYILKLSMEKDKQPLLKNGVVNQLPFIEFDNLTKKKLEKEAINNHNLIEEVFHLDETSLFFRTPAILYNKSINESISGHLEKLEKYKQEHIFSLDRINEMIYNYFSITKTEQNQIEEIIYSESSRKEGTVFDKTAKQFSDGIFSYLLGVVFGRWNAQFVIQPELISSRTDIFAPLPVQAPGANTDEEKIIQIKTPRQIIQDIQKVSKLIWNNKADACLNELVDLLGVRNLEEWLGNTNKFFSTHLTQYTQNKRTAPIYWPLTTASGGFTIWIYYPALTDQTLFNAVNNIIKPEIGEIESEISKIESNSNLDAKGVNQLNELRDFLLELLDFEREILRIAQLPYVPNQNDGVLITASPLHKLFRHAKWRKSTEDCWKALEKGEYDWAHLAYSIWPARVKTKCKKDLSMAIAHGLEDICEIKPKEKQVKKETEPKEKKNKQAKLEL